MKEHTANGPDRYLSRRSNLGMNRSLQFGIVGMILPLLIATRLMTAKNGGYVMQQAKYDATLSNTVQRRGEVGNIYTVPKTHDCNIKAGIGVVQGKIVEWQVNQKGEVAFTIEESERLRSYMLVNGKRTTISAPGARDIRVRKINERGEVIGMIARPDREWNRAVWRAFVWRKGRLFELETFGGPNCFANDINQDGLVVGKADTAKGYYHAFSWREGQPIQDLGTLPRGHNSEAMGSNAKGEIVGSGDVDGETRHALLWRQGGLLDLNRQTVARDGWELQEGREINEQGEILVYGVNEHQVGQFLLKARNPAASVENR